MTLLSSVAGYVLWFYALAKRGISAIGSIQLAMPVITIAAAVVFLGEALTAQIVLIGIAIIGGSW